VATCKALTGSAVKGLIVTMVASHRFADMQCTGGKTATKQGEVVASLVEVTVVLSHSSNHCAVVHYVSAAEDGNYPHLGYCTSGRHCYCEWPSRFV